METKLFGLTAIPAVALLAAVVTTPVQAVTVLTLSGPVADADQIQQAEQTPSIFAGATPTQPAGFG